MRSYNNEDDGYFDKIMFLELSYERYMIIPKTCTHEDFLTAVGCGNGSLTTAILINLIIQNDGVHNFSEELYQSYHRQGLNTLLHSAGQGTTDETRPAGSENGALMDNEGSENVGMTERVRRVRELLSKYVLQVS